MYIYGTSIADTLNGDIFGIADDYIYGQAGDDILAGLGGADRLFGDEGHDVLEGGDGNDTLEGGAGDDLLRAGRGNDTLIGGPGENHLFGDAGNDLMIVTGNDTVDGGIGHDAIDLYFYWSASSVSIDLTALWQGGIGYVNGAGIVNVEQLAFLSGSSFDDNIKVGDVSTATMFDVIRGTGLHLYLGNDIAVGGGHADLIYGDNGDDRISGGAGDDVLDGGNGRDILNGGDGNDYLSFGSGDILDGGAGQDTIDIDLQFGEGSTTVDLTALWNGGVGIIGTGSVTGVELIDRWIMTGYDDVVRTGDLPSGGTSVLLNGGHDAATGGIQGDRFDGGSGNDMLDGAGGNDQLVGGTGRDVLNGGAGDDWLFTDGLDTLDGGAGNDALAILGANSGAMTIDLSKLVSRGLVTINGNTATGIESILYLVGSNQGDVVVTGDFATNGIAYFVSAGLDLRGGNDKATGGAGDDLFFGGDGDDMLSGGAGTDRLNAGAGNDWLDGGAGDDTLFGGTGRDTVSYESVRSRVAVDLAITTAQDTLGGGRDTLQDVESLVGTAYDDALMGDAADNNLFGGAGNDQLSGGAGADRLDGGLGIDSVSYTAATAGITVDLRTGYSSGDTGGDILVGIENLVGTRYDDWIAGATAANILAGGGGIDTISYASAAARVKVDLAIAVAQNTIGAGIDTLSGFENIVGSAFHDTLAGTVGVNRMEGGVGNDLLTGFDGNDTLIGGDGDDTLVGGARNDRLEGGAGIDIVSYADAISAVTVDLFFVAPQATGGGGTDTLIGIEGVIGSAFDDVLADSFGNDRLYGGAGNDRIIGGYGSDLIDGGYGIDTLDYSELGGPLSVTLLLVSAQNTGDAGIDTIRGIENLIGGYRDDVLSGDGYGNVLNGGYGDDVLTGNLGNDVLIGGVGIDTASYAAAAGAVRVSLLLTGAQSTLAAGTDTLSGIENLTGSAHDDQLTGDAADNVLIGNAGNDLLAGGLGNDLLSGGAGIDTASYAAVGAGVTISLLVTAAQDTIGAGVDTLSSIENLVGSTMDDVLTGNAQNNAISGGVGNDLIDGGTGADTLDGGNGNDVLRGGAGNDILTGGAGRDTLTGGAGNDRFVYLSTIQSPASANADRITDFVAGDVLDLSAIDADGAGAGDGAFAIVSAFTGTVGELVLAFDAATATTSLRGDTDGNGIADFSVLFTGDVRGLTTDWLL
ncbi:beta strand repeat-containing protein [Sphingomonas sanxanigenens]|uniref:Peptidase M10 serralysin C-terminal domain-containing protein n=1 Tax=Sphingomonas sanxanigenens DSM 19645 = NX02 TaxID=1123269 RepID=W0A683_9SPHN|nr:calcium-binding protein [Sphingomonas sanxanigenens]AHE51853.1 hypothetical protein NX02_00425 [Sphingomonas sanxanigenens DSM 19645 = NX02]